MTTTIIDRSETVSTLNVGLLSKTVIEHDAGSPPGPVVVKAGTVNDAGNLVVQNQATLDTNDLNLGVVLSQVIVTSGSVLDVAGQVHSHGHVYIGNNSTVELGSLAGLGLLSGMKFIGPNATLELAASAPHSPLDPGVRGFGASDTIDFLKAANVTHVEWMENFIHSGGKLDLFNAQNISVGSIVLAGAYTTSNFAFASDLHGGTAITFHA